MIQQLPHRVAVGANRGKPRKPSAHVNTGWVAALLYSHRHPHHLCSRYRQSFPRVTHSCFQARPPPVLQHCSPCRYSYIQLPCGTALGVPLTYHRGGWRPCCCAVHSPRLIASPKSGGREPPAPSGARSVGVSEVPVGWRAALEWKEGRQAEVVVGGEWKVGTSGPKVPPRIS